MANNIKGITIQIGGDTTKLDKALAGTNKQIKTTQSELKAVEKALKLDPGNTTLLAQKQRLLADGVGQTAEKLKTLKQAAETADEALARGKNYEAKYEPLQAKVEETTKSLQALVAQQGDMEAGLASGKISGEAYDNYNQAVAATKQQLADLQQQQKAVEEEFAGAKLNQQQYDALQREIVETESSLKDLTKQSKEAESSLKKIGDTAGKVADKTKGLSIAAGGIATAMTGMAYKAGLAADDLNTLSKQSGFSTDTIQKWQYASDLIDVSIDDIIGAARKMEKNMASTSESVENAWKQLGVAIVDNNGNFRDAEDVFNDTIAALSHIQSETDRDVLAMTLFGKSANDLSGIIDDGGQALHELGQEAEDMGLILSQDALDGANAFNDAIDRTKAIVSGDLMKAGAQLADTLTPILEDIVGFIAEVVNAFANLPAGVQEGILGFALLTAAISPVAGAISSVMGTINTITTGFGTMSTTISGLTGPVSSAFGAFTSFLAGPAGVVVLVAAAVAGIAVMYEHCEWLRDGLDQFDKWVSGVFATDFTKSFGAIGEVINAWMHNMQAAYEGVKEIFGGLVDFVNGVFSGDWQRAWEGIVKVFGGVMDTMVAAAKAPFNLVIGLINGLISAAESAVNSVVDALNSISVDIPKWVPGVGGNHYGLNIGHVKAPRVPYLAQGGVARANNPFLAVVGDNRREDEVIAPETVIKQWTVQGIQESGLLSAARESGSRTGGSATMTLDGRTFARLIYPYLQAEARRMGTTVKL